MADAFRDRAMAATRIVRGRENELRRQIAELYKDCAERMGSLIDKYGEDSLTGRRADVLRKSMLRYNHQLWQSVQELAVSAVQQGAELGVMAQASVLDDALHGIGLTTVPSFAGVFGRTQDEAVASVLNGTLYSGKRAALSKRIWNNEKLQAGNIEQIIASAVAEGRSATQLARDLSAYVNPSAQMPDHWNDIYPCPFPYRVDYNAKRLAVTALNHAYYQGAIMAARGNPFAEFLHWELSSGHEIYDVCDTYMEHDEGLGLGNFSLDNAPLPHPFCRCTWYIDSSKSLREIGDEIGRWIGGESHPGLDRSFAEWKESLVFSADGGKMKCKEAGFESEKQLANHFNKHKDEFGIIDAETYVRQARSLLMDNAPEIRELIRSDQSLARYKPSTNEFVVGNENGTIRTYFLPVDGEKYWEEELRRNE